ncbi:AAA family ATPase [Mycobacterium botniense]|uniref:Endonuclease GajA/Old nuclease/RecF-like AAA domain-containing protein n=1 Tax=Mycobacterium botniense TaxID=84962 RepID=A0A7I9XZB3_9MYCO|nr:ATP-binding protein [Mycobacterium botniense]GFG75100.1 hypothetical protein MBOT_24650 [Mycobacterium botniense]
MKLHRLVLSNFRGVAHREIEFPDHGVVVVCGANEIGKSSMIEALDLLLEAKDRSTKKEVKQVKPTHADVGSEITAEISTGPYRFVYRKRFHKQYETELTLLTPSREQLTGDEAHDRVRAILAETVDTELWRAQRVLQAASTAAVDLSGCDALSRALDIAAGEVAASAAGESSLIERIDAEYARYFTPTGRPTGEWAAAISRLAAAEEEVARCAAAVAEVDERVRRHASLTEQLAELAQHQARAQHRHATAQAAADKIAVLTEKHHQAQLVAAAAAATSAAATKAHTERLRLRTEFDTRAATVAALDAEARQSADAAARVRADVAAADAAMDQAACVRAAAQRRAESARRILEQLGDRDESERLSARLARIDALMGDRDRVNDELGAVAVTEELERRIEDAAAAVDRARSRLALICATLEFTAAAEIELATGGQRVSLSAGESWSMTVTDSTAVEVPGVLTARVIPAATAIDAQAEYAAAQTELTAALGAAGVADLAAARRAAQQRRDLENSHEQLNAIIAGLCGEDQVDELRCRLARLRAGHSTHSDLAAMDISAARAELEAAEAACAAADAECETRRRVAASVAREFAEVSTRATALQTKVATHRAELDAVSDRLARERASVSDEDLAAAADDERRAAQIAERRVAELAEQLAAAAPDMAAAELAEATEQVEVLRIRHSEVVRALHEVSVELAVFGTEGRQSKLDTAEAERERAAGEYTRVRRRARAAELLRLVMARHRDVTRLRYVEPFRAELLRLGRLVFGSTFDVDIDSELRIRSRTLDGCTVPYESLSGGAKEQLGILVRLAGATLVAKEDTVPVLIDDALGFADPERLARMGEVFDVVGAHGQVIVLTCTPARYDDVQSAHRIELCG